MLSPDDLAALADQLGRRPRGAVAIPVRCPAGHPCVMTTYPLRCQPAREIDGAPTWTPFPTLYWLTCPTLSSAIAHLERDGVIDQLERELAADVDLRKQLAHDHARYIEARLAVLTPQDRATVESDGAMRTEFARGIAGMTNFAAVKCLHAHVAQHLVHGNAVGRLAVDRFGLRPCGASVAVPDASRVEQGQPVPRVPRVRRPH
jgi:hypothetical protein